jgi:hypothetical protein
MAVLASVCLLALLPVRLYADFVIEWDSAAGNGFNNSPTGLQREAAFEYAVSEWDTYLPASFTGTITIDAMWASTGSPASNVLAAAAPYEYFRPSSPSIWYPSALADHLAGYNLDPSNPDISITFYNQWMSTGQSWDLNPYVAPTSSQIDFVSVAMHEITHGLGFASNFASNGSFAFEGSPVIYDEFLANSSGQQLISLPVSSSNVTNAVYWDGPDAEAANGGKPVKLYAPSTFAAGSSLSHLDPTAFPDYLMDPSTNFGASIHKVDPVTIGMLDDMGWDFTTPTTPELPIALLILAPGPVGLLLRRRKR